MRRVVVGASRHYSFVVSSPAWALDRAPARQQLDNQQDEGHDQNQVNQPTANTAE
jgi:hypothetical protein